MSSRGAQRRKQDDARCMAGVYSSKATADTRRKMVVEAPIICDNCQNSRQRQYEWLHTAHREVHCANDQNRLAQQQRIRLRYDAP